ncbi:MAG: VacJ family lipoprotein, partial [Halieaceae bacterium]|nr:VacJ family lipoprotein [Halieaceae bacterium]
MALTRYLLLFTLLLAGTPGVAEDAPVNKDPWEPFNRKMYVFNDTLDRWVLKPTAKGYKFIMPDFAEQGVTNFITNVYDFNSFFNSILQGEFAGSMNAGGRFLINSTVGLLGLVDVATEMGIEPFRSDFGQTLAVWGVGSGPFVMMPVIGPRTVRSTVGYFADTYSSIPALLNDNPIAWTFWTVEIIDYRARLLDAEDLMTGDRYIFLRDAYLQRREFFVTRGKVDDDFS